MTYKLGIDVGSTTLKALVLNDHDEIVYKSYERHKSKVREMSVSKLRELKDFYRDKESRLPLPEAPVWASRMMQGFLSYRRYSQQHRLFVNTIRLAMSS